MLAVPYADLPGQHSKIKADLMAAIGSVLDDGHFILGEPVAQFERQFAESCGVPYAVGVNSGTDALIMALRVLGIGPGDEVITAPNSFVASTSCIRLVGAHPVFVDVGPDYNLNPKKIEAAITRRTRALLPVHLTGRPCRMDEILDIATRRGLYVIEDAAQAVFAEYVGQRVGSFGTIGCFSLHPLKTLNACGDAGVLTTRDPQIDEQLRIMRNLGLRTRDNCVMWAANSRLDTLQAAILLVKLRHTDAWTEQRRANARFYQDRLAGLHGLMVPSDAPDERAVYHTFVAQVDNRERLRAHLSERSIGSAIHYPVPIHLSAAGRELGYGPGSFPMAEAQASRILSLPVHQDLTTDQLDTVCNAIVEFYAQHD
jgi:dTDP-4-amino-4,6-dideoxygalactose transaminase